MEDERFPTATMSTSPGFEDLPEGDGVIVLSPQGRILSASLQAERLLRREVRRGRLLPLEELFSPAALPQAAAACREALQDGMASSNLLGEVKPGPGPAFFLHYSVLPLFNQKDKITGLILVFRDSTLSRAWSAWNGHRREVGPEAALEHYHRGVFIIDRLFRITSFNRMARELTGFGPKEVLGKHCWEVLRSNRCQHDCPLKATLRDGQTRVNYDITMVKKSGERLTILVTTWVIKNPQGAVVGAAQTFQPLPREQSAARETAAPARRLEIIGQSRSIRHLLAKLPDIAASEASVVLEGESGTGKDLFAQYLHRLSPRAQGPYVAFNCAALVDTLIESELFGHTRGAFTGAIANKMGRFELAKGGTLFLDEVGELKPELQTKLLRVLEEKVFERVGGTKPIPLEARVIAATSRDLVAAARQGRFRLDLLYRLRTVPLYLSPLRQRPEDIPLLVQHFVALFNRKHHKDVRAVDPKVIELFLRYPWPGNIRELERALEYAFVFVKGPLITTSHLPDLTASASLADVLTLTPNLSLPQYQWEDERRTIQQALAKAKGRRETAARLFGISRSSLWRKMKAHGLATR